MALLSVEKRKEYFAKLGIAYNKGGIEALQRKYMRKKDVDGIYGTDTDRVLRHVHNVLTYTKNFRPEEFKCECGGKYCTGYPSYMKKVELQNLQSIRTHIGKPMIITSGLRCKGYNNSLRGSIKNSRHLTGYAADFHIKGYTGSLSNRKALIKWIKTLPNHNYTYCNGYNSNGVKISAKYMGTAIHTDTHKPATTSVVAAKASKKKKSSKIKKITLVTRAEYLEALKKQYEWSKNAIYAWVEGPDIKNSKKKNTCISLPNVALQRIGYLKKGKYVFFSPIKKKIWGNARSYVKRHKEAFKVSYPNKTVMWLYKHGLIKPGDFVGYGGKGYHSMSFLGVIVINGKKVPIFATMGHKRGYGIPYPAYAKRKVNMLINIKFSDD